MKFRLVAYTPFTEEKWPLPSPLSYSVVYVLNSLHSLEFTYPDSQSAANVITPDKGYPYEYAVEYFNPSTETWDEPLGSRFIGMKVSSDQIEEMPTKKYSSLGLKWLFRKAKVWSTGGVAGSDERVFKDVTIGSILITLFTEAYKRGIKVTNPANIGFTDKVDSSGTSWGGTVSMAFPINMSLEEVLNDLAEQGFIDWDMQGRRTLVWKADSSAGLARDKRSIYLQNVTGTTSAPEEVSFESMMTTARVLGETQSWEYSNNLSSPWGRLEDVVSQSGVIDPVTAKEASEKILLEGERPIKTHTKELSGYSSLQPLIDVRIGDWVRGQTNRDRTKPTSFEDMRIQEISLDVTGSDYTWNVSMGDRRSDMLEKIARRQNALSGGSSGGTSRTPSGGTAQTGDWRVPTTPTNFSVRIDSHLDADTSRYKGRAVFTWFDDHMGLDKYDNSLSPQARRGYEVSYRVAGTTNWTTLAWYGPDADKSPQIYYPLDVINPATNRPYTYEFRLRTLGAETYSPYTTAVAVQTVADQEAPEKPTKPTTEASLGVITVSWDKKAASGKAMPLDFSHLIVESRHYADTEVIKEVGQIYGNSLPLVGLTEGVPYQFRFVAVDTAGNRSTPSDWSVATVIQPLVDTKSIQDALTSANNALDAAVEETNGRLTELNKYMSESFGEFTEDMQSVWSAINSPDVFAQDEPPKEPKTGQLWIDTNNSNIISLWDGNTWVQLRDGAIQELQRALEKKSTTYFSNTAPSEPAYGDLWFNPSKNNEVRRWDNSWVLVTDPQISAALSQAQSAKAAADGKIQTFLSDTAPASAGLGNGDLWFDSNDGNRMYRWNSTTKSWEDARDASIDEFYDWQQDLIASLEGGEYGRLSTYYQNTPPQGPMPGDLWVDTSTGGTLKIWNSSTSKWDPVTDPALSDTVNSIASDVDALQDSVIQTYVQPNPPANTDSHTLSVGDLWFDSDDNNKMYRYDPSVTTNGGWAVVQDKNIDSLRTAVSTKITTHYGGTAPATKSVGDLWFNQSNNNEVKRWNGTSWVSVTDPNIQVALNKATTAQATADGKIESFFQVSAPTSGMSDGDLWFDTDDNNKLHRWNASTSKWDPAQDGRIDSLLSWQTTLVNDLNSGKYSKVSTFYQSTAPSSPNTGDLWVDTANSGALKTWTGSTWTVVTDPSLKNSITTISRDVEAIKDGVIETYAQTSAPVASGTVKLSLGDLWFDTDDNNKLYRYDPAVTTNGGWVPVQDKNISALQSAVASKITTYYSTTAPSAPVQGDLWIDQSTGNTLKRWTNNAWVTITDANVKAALDKANDAKAIADGKVETYFQVSAPTSGMSDGDLWFDTDDSNRLYRWNASTSKWDPAQDGRIDGLISWQTTLVKDLTAGKYNKVSTFYQSTAPSSPNTGDLWVDTANSGALKTWTGSTWTVVTDPSLKNSITTISRDVEAIKDGVIETYAQTSAPVASGTVKLSLGDLWFDTDDNNKLYRYDPAVTTNGGWVPVQDKNISALQSAVASKITTYYSTTAPSAPVQGDLWIDQSTGNTLKRWTNNAWVTITDANVKAALDKANDAKAIADGKVQTFFQDDAPPAAGLADGDLWFDTNDGNKMYRWDGVSTTKSWVSVRDGFITSFPNWEANFIKAIRAGDYARVSTFYQTIAPANPIDGDLWMDTASGVLKRFNKSANRWDIIQDAALKRSISDLGTDIEAIQDQVINTYVSPTAPTGTTSRPLAVGDLWFDSSNSNKLYRRSASGSWDPVSDTSATEALAKTIPTVIHSTTVADSTSSAANGSTWFQHLPSITSPVVAQWTKDNGKWVPVTVSSEVIANLDVGKLTAGSASLSTAVVDKLFANIFAAKKISASELAVAPGSVFPDPLFQGSSGYAPWTVVGGGIELSGTGKQTGGYSPNLEVAVSPGDEYVLSFDKNVYPDTNRVSTAALYARYYDQSGAMISSGNLILSHNSEDSLTKSVSWVVPEGVYKVQFGFFVQGTVVGGTRIRVSNPQMVRKVGGILIKDGGVTAEHVTASKSLTAKMAQFLTVTANMIEANAITASHLTAGSVQAQHMNFQGPLVNGEGYQLVIDSTGIKFYYVSGASGGSSAEPDRKLVTALTGESAGENGALYSIVDRGTGMTLASMTEGGDVNGVQGNFENDISIGGLPLTSPGGLLDDLPKGAIPGSAVETDLRGTVKPAGEWGFSEVSLLADPDRVYRINTESFILKVTGPRDMRYTIRFTDDGTMPTVDSPVLRHYFDSRDPATTGTNYHQMGGTSTLFRPKSNNADTAPKQDGKVRYRFLFCVYRGHTNLEFIGGDAGPFVAWIEDIGPDLMYAGTVRNSFKAFETTTTPTEPTPPAPSKSLYTKSYSVASHKNFYVTLPGPVSKGEYVWSTYTRDNLFFGGFDSRNLWSFATMANMTSDLSGAEIKSIKATFKVSDTYASSGANVGVWIHGYSSYGTQSPSSLGTAVKTISGAKEGSTYSVDIPSKHFPMFKSGGIRGIAFGFNSHVNLPLNGRILRSSIKFAISYYK